jgi:uncharacterized protein (DUF169 family)
MKPRQTDLSIYKKFNFDRTPVGVKFLAVPPEGIEKLDTKMALCEMMNEAQQRGKAFYMDKDNEDCAGAMIMGMIAPSPHAGGGELGVKWGIYEEARVNEKLGREAPHMPYGNVNYIVFAPLEQINFEPDLLFLVANVSQAEIVLRAISYSTGTLWESRATSGGACAYFFAYPYLSGKVNYITTGVTLGLKGRRVYPEGLLLFSIPYNQVPVITRNLEKMEWVLPAYTDKTREAFLERRKNIFMELAKEFGGK